MELDYKGYIIKLNQIDGGFTYKVTRNETVCCYGVTNCDTRESIMSKLKKHLDIRIFSDETGE